MRELDVTMPLERCEWPGCEHSGVLVQVPTGETWCICHAADDVLPELRSARIQQCARCRQGTIWETTWERKTFPIHQNCLRPWITGATTIMDTHPSKMKGAYARRSRP